MAGYIPALCRAGHVCLQAKEGFYTGARGTNCIHRVGVADLTSLEGKDSQVCFVVVHPMWSLVQPDLIMSLHACPEAIDYKA
jgi:hypothetical protein